MRRLRGRGVRVRARGRAVLLQFLRRRGLKLGLRLEDVRDPFKAPLETLGLLPLFDVAVFSRVTKAASSRTRPSTSGSSSASGFPPERVLFVGDSSTTTVAAPAALGMRTAAAGGDVALASAATHLLDIDGDLRPLAAAGRVERSSGRPAPPARDDEQGRYNVIFSGEVEGTDPPRRVYLKRFLLPGTAELEAFVYRLRAATGLEACDASVLPGAEPLLAVSEAPGRKLGGEARDPRRGGPPLRLRLPLLERRPRGRAMRSRIGRRPGAATVVDLKDAAVRPRARHGGTRRAVRAPNISTPDGRRTIAAHLGTGCLSPKTWSRARRTFRTCAGRGAGPRVRRGLPRVLAADALLQMIAGRLEAGPPLVDRNAVLPARHGPTQRRGHRGAAEARAA